MNNALLMALGASDDASRLVCFPHVGAGAGEYRAWVGGALRAEVWAIQPPGRGPRLAEPPIEDAYALARLAAEEIAAHVAPPYALFGHSLGALTAFETARALRTLGAAPPDHLFVSGHRGPQLPRRHDDPLDRDEDVLAVLRSQDAERAKVLDDRALFELLLPTLRADFRMAGDYRFVPDPPLDVPLHVFGGAADPGVTPAELDGWRPLTTRTFTVRLFPGGHFYLDEARPLLLATIDRALAKAPVR